MKKLMFLTVLLNLMIALPSTVLAQVQLRFDIGSGAGTPAHRCWSGEPDAQPGYQTGNQRALSLCFYRQ